MTQPAGAFCSQRTVRGDLCMHRATWTEINRRGEREFYCTRHANNYLPWRRGGERVSDASRDSQQGENV